MKSISRFDNQTAFWVCTVLMVSMLFTSIVLCFGYGPLKHEQWKANAITHLENTHQRTLSIDCSLKDDKINCEAMTLQKTIVSLVSDDGISYTQRTN